MLPELHVQQHVYQKPFPRFGRPKIIGFIGLENLKFARHVHDNNNVRLDLNLHLDKAKHRPDDIDVKLTELLQFLLEHELRLRYPLENNLEKANFFCYRGLLTCIACTPYEKQEPWKIVAVLSKGSIYLCARDTDYKKEKRSKMTEREKCFQSWGYKFEQFILSDSPDSDPNPDIPLDETKEFSLMFTTHLNNHSIVYGAEMDGIRCDTSPVSPPPPAELGPEPIIQYLSNQHFVELKTNRHIEFPKQERNFRCYKLKKWWCQSFLAGIDTILCGLRNDKGIVEKLKTYQIKDLVKMSQKFWNPDVCFNFLDTFLTYVKRCLAREIERKHGHKALNNLQALPLVTLLFEWSPGMPVRASDNYINEEDPILPQYFLESYGKCYAEP